MPNLISRVLCCYEMCLKYFLSKWVVIYRLSIFNWCNCSILIYINQLSGGEICSYQIVPVIATHHFELLKFWNWANQRCYSAWQVLIRDMAQGGRSDRSYGFFPTLLVAYVYQTNYFPLQKKPAQDLSKTSTICNGKEFTTSGRGKITWAVCNWIRLLSSTPKCKWHSTGFSVFSSHSRNDHLSQN